MSNKLTEWLVKPFINEVDLPIKVGDDVLMGRFKNKRVKVKSIDYNEKGDLLINGRPALKFRLVKGDKKLLPTKTTKKSSAEPDSDRKGVDDEYPHHKTESKLQEAEPKFQSVHTRSSFNQTFGGWYSNYVPLSTKFMQKMIGNTRVSVFHVGSAEMKRDIQQVGRIIGKKGSLSTFTAVDKGEKLAKGQGIQSKGGVIYQIEGTLLVASTRDIQSTPDKTGRRWVPPTSLAGKVAGGKMYDELKKGIKANKLDRDTWNSIERKEEAKWEKEVDYYSDNYKGSYEEKEEALKKIMGPLKRKWIKKYIDMCYKIMKKYQPQIKRHILSQKDKGSEYGWNEIVVNQIHIQDVFLLKRVGQYSSIRDEVEKIAKGTVTVGSPAQFRKWYNQRGGIINEAKRIPRKKGQHRGSKSHSDLYTDENPKGTIKGLKFATVKDAKASVSKIRGSGKTHAHKIQAAVAMEQRAREMGKTSEAAVYRAYINQMKKKTKKKNESDEYTFGPDYIPTNLAQRKKMKRIHQKTNRSSRVSGRKNEGWSDKYKKSIDCNNPKGFSQKAHCDGKKKNESFFGLGPGDVPSPSRKMVKKMKKKGNTSVPYGSGYKKVNEQKEIKKVIAIYPGRFQPFGPHHKKVYDALKSKFGEAYITTSDIQQPPRHPMNFNEKVKHMVKMGIPKNRIVKEKVPYVANNLLKKFNKDTTAVVYVFGAKDAGRLKGGKKKSGGLTYYQDLKSNLNNLKGFEEHGYIYEAPFVKVSGISSGTEIRKLLGSPKFDDKKRQQIFKKTFGYFDKSTYEMMTSRFKKLFEFFQQPQVKKLMKEVSGFGTSINASDMSDEGMYDFFGSLDDYYRISPEHAEHIGYELIDFPVRDSEDMMFTIMADEYEKDRTKTVTHGRTINQNRKNKESVDNPFPKYKERMRKTLGGLGFEIIKYFGEESFTKMKESPLLAKKDIDKGVSHIKKVQEGFMEDVKLLIEGGAYGHMNHPFDDNNLMFSDLKNIIIIGLEGKLNREDNVSEKLDGQNLMISWVDGKLKAARNKGHLKNGGKTAPTTSGIASMFAGRGNIKKAFVGAMRDLEKSIGSLSDAQKKKIFGNGTKWMNLEVIYPQTSNIIDYDVAEIVFHGTTEYDMSGRAKGYSKDAARMLQGMIKQVNQNIQKTFKISKPNFLKMSKVQDFSKKKSTFLNKLNKLQSQYGLKDSDKLGMYHQSYWQEYIFNAAKQFKVKLKSNQLVNLTNRWAFFDKSYSIGQIKKDFKDNPQFIDWILKTDKLDHNKMFKQNIKPFEILFFQVGAEILKNMSGFLAVSPDTAVQKIKKDVDTALKDLQKPDKVEKLRKLKIQIEKLEAIGGSSAIVPSEGLVFKYKGNIYKFTGAFAPINQILGSLKF